MAKGDFDLTFEREIDAEYEDIEVRNFDHSHMDPNMNEYLNGEITYTEVANAIRSQKSTAKSYDSDDLHPKILKRLPSTAVKILAKLFNLVLDTGRWVWDASNVTFII